MSTVCAETQPVTHTATTPHLVSSANPSGREYDGRYYRTHLFGHKPSRQFQRSVEALNAGNLASFWLESSLTGLFVVYLTADVSPPGNRPVRRSLPCASYPFLWWRDSLIGD
ncbi:hypothetical protein BaRGS_00040582 [Batillaria attramentaria]|uniref:Uncharacterized protein n=1 Tax=Batillaria attramentaria TaxID=370345 RepID=A0ABD0IYS3_9CAEN